ncbi:MAG: DUF4145 domain-containing protein [Planctomycetes bacterium]|nr:DUF4145 domain-containing protein [Planctomycetota bacterium]
MGELNIKALCNSCGRKTNHVVVAEATAQETDTIPKQLGKGKLGEEEILWTSTHQLIRCQGCGCVSFRSSEENSPYWGPIFGDPWTYYPPRIARREPNWLSELWAPLDDRGKLDDHEIPLLLREVYNALQMGSSRLAMMGMRAIFDMVIRKTVGDQGSFAAGLNELVKTGNLAQKSRDFIEAAVEVGHATAHRGHNPSSDDLMSVMDIAEHLLLSSFVLRKRAARLRKSTPPRKARTP